MATAHAHVIPLNPTSAADDALAGIRAALRRSRVAAEWDRLSTQQRAMLCYGAKLRPSTYAHMALEDMTDDEREALRRALVEMKRGLREFVCTDRTEWRHVPANTGHHQQRKQQQEREETLARLRLSQQARQLGKKLESINAKSPASGN